MTTATADWLVSGDLAPDDTDGRLAPFYAAAARGALSLPVCGRCALALELEQRVCDGCGADEIAWPEVERDGVVHAMTMVHRREPGLILTEQPYPVADVELSSGHRLVLTTTRPCTEPPDIGEAVRIEFRSVGGVAIPAISLPEQPTSEVTG